MHENDIEKLLRVGRALEDKKAKLPTKSSETFYYTKRTIEEICKSLSVRIDDYSPENTVKIIENYLKNEDKINRLLYSHLSNCVFALDENGKGLFATNVENLMLYTISRKDISEDCQKIVIKIYDHFHLALHQTEKINKTFADSFADNIKDTADNLKTEIKGIEREYISILGIFASVILSFVGGITFSTSVLQNISEVSIYRLLMVVVLLALVLMNVIWLLIKFIVQINDKKIKLFKIANFNRMCFIIMILIMVAWLFKLNNLAEFIGNKMPWHN